MPQELPPQASLEHLKAQAKDALQRLKITHPAARLHQAQYQVAQSYGFPSWPKLVAHVQSATPASAEELETLDHALVSVASQEKAKQLLMAKPHIKKASLPGACLALDLSEIKRRLPSDQTTRSPRIAYVAFSPFAVQKPGSYVRALQSLLAAGENPNASIELTDYPNNPLSVLYAASGVARNPAATRLLLDAGATPDDNESLYHSNESADHTCLKLLLDAGAKIEGTNALLHMLDREDMDGLELLLARKPDLNCPPSIVHAIARNRSVAIVRRLLEAGADPSASEHGQSGAALAFERGYEIEGLTDTFQPTDINRLLRACWMGDIETAQSLAHLTPRLMGHQRRAFSDACWAGNAASIDAFLAAGFTWNDRDGSRGTPLHCAAYAGSLPTVQALLRHGPPLDDKNDMYRVTPLQWALHASQNELRDGGDYPGCVRALIDAGSPKPPGLFGSAAVRAVLRSYWPDLS